MPKGRVLTTAEREQITRLHEGGASAREIAKKLERSKTVVLNFLKNPAQYAQIKRSGRKRALSRDDERRLYAALFETSAYAAAQPQAPGAEAPRGADEVDATAAASVSGAAALNAVNEPLYMPPPQHQPHDVKMSAEQIKKVFNVPLSTRRIQQLLSEWRREARRAQDRQQLGDSAGGAPAMPLITEAHATAAGTSSLESIAELPPLVESSGASAPAAVSTLAPEAAAAAPAAKSEAAAPTSEAASPNDLSSSGSTTSAPVASDDTDSSDETLQSSSAPAASAGVDAVAGATTAPVPSEDQIAAPIDV